MKFTQLFLISFWAISSTIVSQVEELPKNVCQSMLPNTKAFYADMNAISKEQLESMSHVIPLTPTLIRGFQNNLFLVLFTLFKEKKQKTLEEQFCDLTS